MDRRAQDYHQADAPRALGYRAAPSSGLTAAMGDPRLEVAPPLPTTTGGTLAATSEELAAWMAYHGIPDQDTH